MLLFLLATHDGKGLVPDEAQLLFEEGFRSPTQGQLVMMSDTLRRHPGTAATRIHWKLSDHRSDKLMRSSVISRS
jgi:hypothetical protein